MRMFFVQIKAAIEFAHQLGYGAEGSQRLQWTVQSRAQIEAEAQAARRRVRIDRALLLTSALTLILSMLAVVMHWPLEGTAAVAVEDTVFF